MIGKCKAFEPIEPACDGVRKNLGSDAGEGVAWQYSASCTSIQHIPGRTSSKPSNYSFELAEEDFGFGLGVR